MTCKNCDYWKLIPSNGSAQGDREMKALDYANCLQDKSKPQIYRFLHKDAKACDKYKAKTS